MNTLISRSRPFLGAVGAVFAIYLFFCACYHMGVAHAATLVGDPTVIGTDTLDAGWNMIATYGWTWGGMALVFMTASWALKKNDSQHWIAQGKTLAYIVGAIGIGTTIVQAKLTGAPWSGVALTVVVALFKLINPTSTPKMATQSPVAAALTIAMLAGVLGGVGSIGCSGSSAKTKELKSALWNCTDPVRADAVAAVTPLMISVLKAATSADGKLIDYSTVKAATSKASLMTEAGVLLSCAAASAFAFLTAPQPTVPGSAASAPFVIDPAALQATWARLKAEQLGDTRFLTSSGAM